MRKLLTSILVALAVAGLPGCMVWDDNYTVSTSPGARKVVVIGDSITFQSETEIRAALPNFDVRILAVVGNTFHLTRSGCRWPEGQNGDVFCIGVEYTFLGAAAAADPDIIVMALGTNDGGTTLFTMAPALAAVPEHVQVVTMYPSDYAHGIFAVPNPTDLAVAGCTTPSPYAEECIQWGPRLRTGLDPLRPLEEHPWLQPDGVHPTETGRGIFAE